MRTWARSGTGESVQREVTGKELLWRGRETFGVERDGLCGERGEPVGVQRMNLECYSGSDVGAGIKVFHAFIYFLLQPPSNRPHST